MYLCTWCEGCFTGKLQALVAKPGRLEDSKGFLPSVIYCEQVHFSSLFLRVLKVTVFFFFFSRKNQRASMEIVAKLLEYGDNWKTSTALQWEVPGELQSHTTDWKCSTNIFLNNLSVGYYKKWLCNTRQKKRKHRMSGQQECWQMHQDEICLEIYRYNLNAISRQLCS